MTEHAHRMWYAVFPKLMAHRSLFFRGWGVMGHVSATSIFGMTKYGGYDLDS